jgi:NADPH-dependent F420 reductase
LITKKKELSVESSVKPTVAIVGGTGALGIGLARRLSKAGYPVIVGSRKIDAAEAAMLALTEKFTTAAGAPVAVSAATNESAAAAADVVFVTVPFAAHTPTLEGIKSAVVGKVVVDVTVPLVPPKVARVQLPPEGSAGQIAQALLGESVYVVSALQNVAAHHLDSDDDIDCDVLVTGNEKAARQTVIDMLSDIGLTGYHAGLINNAAAAEALTSLLININKQYKTYAGIRITGIDP